MSEQVRLGVIGLGNIAQQHIENVVNGHVAGCEVTAVCTRGGQTLAQQLNIAHFNDTDTLIDSGLCDAVLVATPTYTHSDMGAAVLNAGLHLLMEKPLDLSLKRAEETLAMKGAEQVFAVMLNQRTDPLFLAMQEVIANGTIGDITRTHWTMTNWFRPEAYFQVSDWRATWRGEGGGLLLNQCIHNLDIFQWLCGMPSKLQAFCRFGHTHNIEVEDEATAYFEYANGASGVFVGSTGEAPGVNRFDVIGDKGHLSFDGEKLWLTENQQSAREFSRNTLDMFGMPETSRREIVVDRHVNQHALVLSNFVTAITRGAELIAPASEGLASLELANAMLLSSWEQRSLTLPLNADEYQIALQKKLENSSLRQIANIDVNIDMDASYR
ncbi:MAG: Gfo/Idh/MocA family oxidoreductase [Pseudomonadota bacterium]